MSKNIVLIGFMGVGKGTIARALFNKSDYFIVDTDDLIESTQNKKIKNIFNDHGEQYFRHLEYKCALWCEKNLTNTIISTGGGFYKQHNIKKIGQIVYLESSFDNILKKLKEAPNSVKKFKKRPLLQDIQQARIIYNERIHDYKNIANITINIEDWDICRITKEIFRKLD